MRIHNNIALIRLERGQSEGITVLTTEIATPAEQAADSNLLNLLIVDDERAVRESCREVAEALGFHIAGQVEGIRLDGLTLDRNFQRRNPVVTRGR